MAVQLMLPPVVFRELVQLANRRWTYVLRTLVAILIYVVAILSLYSALTALGTWRAGSVLGGGGFVLAGLHSMVSFGAHLIIPAMAVGSVISERENGTLELLLLTRTTPRQIVFQKLVARSIPPLSMLLLAVPFMAVVYGLGGVSVPDLLFMFIAWTLMTFRLCLIGLMSSATSKSAAQALVRAYLLLVLFSLGGCMLSMPIMMGFGGMNVGSGYALHAVAESVSLLILFFPLFAITKRRIANTEPRRMIPVSRLVSEELVPVSRNAGGRGKFSKFLRSTSLAHDRPVAWRECRKASVGSPESLRKLCVCSMLLAGALLVAIMPASLMDGGGENPGYSFVICTTWVVACIVICVHLSNVISRERANGTLEILLATPLSAHEILRQKLAGAWRLCLVFSVPIIMGVLLAAFLEPDLDAEYSWYSPHWRYLILSLVTHFLFFYALVWVAYAVALTELKRARVFMSVLASVFAVIMFPFLLALVSAGLGADPIVPEALCNVSPVVFMAMLEFSNEASPSQLQQSFLSLGYVVVLVLLMVLYVRWRGPALLHRQR